MRAGRAEGGGSNNYVEAAGAAVLPLGVKSLGAVPYTHRTNIRKLCGEEREKEGKRANVLGRI